MRQDLAAGSGLVVLADGMLNPLGARAVVSSIWAGEC
jgi:hypothetical protein